MAKQTLNGKAFEYACIESIALRYTDKVQIIEEKNSAYNTAKGFYDNLNDTHKNILSKGANKGIEIVERLEANLLDFSEKDALSLEIQTDSQGQSGDVRDIVISKNNAWEIGISAKHNHEAVKHSRLSPSINFGQKWIGLSCSDEYMSTVSFIFSKLEKYIKMPWKEIDVDKDADVYKPLLDAFKTELLSLYEIYGDVVPAKLVQYLLGEHDFYKFVLDVNKEIIKVNAYNLLGSLNKSTQRVKSEFKLPKISLPTRIFHLDYVLKNGIVSNNTIELICNNGWQFTFRIHNASSKVEPSMKFDIQLVGVPTNIQSFIGII